MFHNMHCKVNMPSGLRTRDFDEFPANSAVLGVLKVQRGGDGVVRGGGEDAQGGEHDAQGPESDLHIDLPPMLGQ